MSTTTSPITRRQSRPRSQGLRRRVGEQRILAVLEPRSNTMRLGVHNRELAASLDAADRVFVFAPADLGWDAAAVFAGLAQRAAVHADLDALAAAVVAECVRAIRCWS